MIIKNKKDTLKELLIIKIYIKLDRAHHEVLI